MSLEINYVEYVFNGKSIFSSQSKIAPPENCEVNIESEKYFVKKIDYFFYNKFQEKQNENSAISHIIVFVDKIKPKKFISESLKTHF